jgi:hypothetical protein
MYYATADQADEPRMQAEDPKIRHWSAKNKREMIQSIYAITYLERLFRYNGFECLSYFTGKYSQIQNKIAGLVLGRCNILSF